jgi:hypothetical protein
VIRIPESVITMPGIGDHVRPESVITMLRNTQIDADPRFVLELTQNGSTFSGRVMVTGVHLSNIVNGVVTDPRNITFRREWTGEGFFGVYTGDYKGSVDSALNKIAAESIPGVTFNLTRQ